jgi:hypothetical protein
LAAAASSVDGRKGGGEGNNNNNNNNNNAGGGAAAAGGRRMAQFLEVYQQLKKELLSDSDLFQYTPESRSWVEEMLDYTVPGGAHDDDDEYVQEEERLFQHLWKKGKSF